MSTSTTPAENWRAIPGFEERYEVSDRGRVRSLRDWHRRPRAVPHVLRPATDDKGYLRVQLGRGTTRTVHRLVLAAFIGPCPLGREAGHLNGVRIDNRLGNLRWITSAENKQHQFLHGTAPTGERNPSRRHPERVPRGTHHPRAKLTEQQVLEIRAAIGRGESQPSVAARFGVTRGAVSGIAEGRTWRHLRAEAAA